MLLEQDMVADNQDEKLDGVHDEDLAPIAAKLDETVLSLRHSAEQLAELLRRGAFDDEPRAVAKTFDKPNGKPDLAADQQI